MRVLSPAWARAASVVAEAAVTGVASDRGAPAVGAPVRDEAGMVPFVAGSDDLQAASVKATSALSARAERTEVTGRDIAWWVGERLAHKR